MSTPTNNTFKAWAQPTHHTLTHTHTHTLNGSSIASRTFAQLWHKVPTGYNGAPSIHPQNCPFSWVIANSDVQKAFQVETETKPRQGWDVSCLLMNSIFGCYQWHHYHTACLFVQKKVSNYANHENALHISYCWWPRCLSQSSCCGRCQLAWDIQSQEWGWLDVAYEIKTRPKVVANFVRCQTKVRLWDALRQCQNRGIETKATSLVVQLDLDFPLWSGWNFMSTSGHVGTADSKTIYQLGHNSYNIKIMVHLNIPTAHQTPS